MRITHTSFRLSAEGRKMLARLAAHFGLNRTGVLEWLIREKSRALGLDKPRRRE